MQQPPPERLRNPQPYSLIPCVAIAVLWLLALIVCLVALFASAHAAQVAFAAAVAMVRVRLFVQVCTPVGPITVSLVLAWLQFVVLVAKVRSRPLFFGLRHSSTSAQNAIYITLTRILFYALPNRSQPISR